MHFYPVILNPGYALDIALLISLNAQNHNHCQRTISVICFVPRIKRIDIAVVSVAKLLLVAPPVVYSLIKNIIKILKNLSKYLLFKFKLRICG